MSNPLQILHLEDNPSDAELIHLTLARTEPGAQITLVRNRSGFVSALKERSFDLILADYNLPDFDGIGALQFMLQTSPDTPFILVTGNGGEELAVESIRQGAADFLLKDQLGRLGGAVHRAVREGGERRARRHADEQLNRSRQVLAAIVESSTDAIVGKDLSGTITSWNAGAEKIFGYTAAEAVGSPIAMLLPPDRIDEAAGHLARTHRGERIEPVETVRVRKDGSLIDVSVAISPIKNAAGQVVGASKIARDITSGKRFEEALRASESHYRLLFQSNPTPVLVYDRKSLAILTANEAATRHYGHTLGEISSKNLADIALSQDVPAFVAKLSGLPDGIGNCGVWRHRKKDGRLCEMDITSHALVFAGRPAWLSLAVDVTERLNLEAQLLHSQKMESVGQLAGGIAHDFNNLLTVIHGHTGLLLAMDDLAPKLADPVREIANAARRAAELTRQLLTFSRKNILQPQIVDLNEVVGNVGKMLRRILGEDIKLETGFSPNLPSVKADLGMMEQVLLNLAVNSRDAMPRGGRLRIATSAPMVDAAQVQSNPEAATGRHVCLEFADTGCGISAENLPRIFEPFFTTKELDRGTGLGLATVYGIIRQHQGWIQVSSRVNQGTTFQIFLPACSQASSPLTMPPGEQRVIGGTETILAVEDEAPLLRLIKHILESFGYKVLECSNGKAALEIWGEHRKKIDLLLTDIVLPDGMAGSELAELLMASKPNLKVVYTSGYNAETLARNIPVAQGAKFIQKPFHARKLAETVYDCLNDKAATTK